MLVEHYMPRAAAKQLEIAEVFRDLYTTWLVLAPVSNGGRGYWRPWWCPGVVMSWLRTEVNRFQRPCLGRIQFDWASAKVAPGALAARIQDGAFIAHAEALLGHAWGDTLRANFTRYVLGGLVWRAAAEQALAVAREHQAGLMWHEDGLWLLARKPFGKDGVAWSDLRETPADILAWSVKVADGKLQARMSESSVRRFKESVRAAMASDSTPEHKLRQINAASRSWHHWARYAFDARQQASGARGVDMAPSQSAYPTALPKLRGQYFDLKTAQWDARLHLAGPRICWIGMCADEAWLNIWNPVGSWGRREQ
jgi:hypothetical protein